MAGCSEGTGKVSKSSQTASKSATVRPGGVYTVTTTHADLLAAGPDPHEDVPENYGKWVYVFRGDRLAYSQENKDACTWAYGKVTFSGPTFSWAIIEGGYPKAPHKGYNKPGEFFSFAFSMRGDTLKLSPAPPRRSSSNPGTGSAPPLPTITSAATARHPRSG
ncbi:MULTISPECIES: hypothetical protein [Streptomyces]|uniref:hypothetical protein n=1 Tax=Streptomyces TaxID=1883 RepID=UPI000B2ACE48|nr:MULTISPECIES: hypothetical protein [Streptomyces]MDI5913219.1 hypothetical protein [Streptomyces sp. 12257]